LLARSSMIVLLIRKAASDDGSMLRWPVKRPVEHDPIVLQGLPEFCASNG